MNKDTIKKWNNTSIKVISELHGANVIEFWKSIGVDTKYYKGTDINHHYGLFNNEFGDFYRVDAHTNHKILTLEEAIAIRDKDLWKPQFGEMVEVSFYNHCDAIWLQRIYIGTKDNLYHCVYNKDENIFKLKELYDYHEGYRVYPWKYIRKIEPLKPIEISLEETKEIIAKSKNVSVEQINLNFKID